MKRLLEWKEFRDPWEIEDEDIHLSKRRVRNIVRDIAEKYYHGRNIFGTPMYLKEKREQLIKIWPVQLDNLGSHAIHHDVNDPILIKMVNEIKDKFQEISGCKITYKIRISENEYGGDPELRGKTFMYDVVTVYFKFYVTDNEDNNGKIKWFKEGELE